MKNAFASLLRHGSAARPARTLGAPTVWRLIACYAVAIVLVAAINWIAPLAQSGRGRTWSPWVVSLVFGEPSGLRVVPVWLDAMLAMAGAFVMTVPIVIVYVRTRTHAAFDDSLASTVLVLPSIVTAILIVVQNSLALAFSLAGIVAAVRFRMNLKESRDALYIFAAVAIGFAAGIYALDVALMASLVFVLLEVLTWRTILGSEPARSDGDNRKRAKETPPGTAAEREAGSVARNAILRVQVTDVDEGRHVVEPLLDSLTKAWQRSRIGRAEDAGDHVVLEYQVRFRRRYPAEEVRDHLLRHGRPLVASVDLAPPDQSAMQDAAQP